MKSNYSGDTLDNLLKNEREQISNFGFRKQQIRCMGLMVKLTFLV